MVIVVFADTGIYVYASPPVGGTMSGVMKGRYRVVRVEEEKVCRRRVDTGVKISATSVKVMLK